MATSWYGNGLDTFLDGFPAPVWTATLCPIPYGSSLFLSFFNFSTSLDFDLLWLLLLLSAFAFAFGSAFGVASICAPLVLTFLVGGRTSSIASGSSSSLIGNTSGLLDVLAVSGGLDDGFGGVDDGLGGLDVGLGGLDVGLGGLDDGLGVGFTSSCWGSAVIAGATDSDRFFFKLSFFNFLFSRWLRWWRLRFCCYHNW